MLTYNRYNYLERAINSVLSQKDCDFELIIVNNGSTDGSLELCKKYLRNDSRIKLVSLPRSSIGAGRNAGIACAEGDYISFVDDDDYMDEDMFSYLYGNACKYNVDISICGCYSDFGDRLAIYYVYDGLYTFDKLHGTEELLKREKYNSANPCKLFRISLFSKVTYLENGKYDDIHTIYKLFTQADSVVVSGLPKYYFTKHATNNSGFIETNALTPEQLKEYINAFRDRTKYLSENLPEIKDRARYSEWSYMISMIDKISQNNLSNCFGMLEFMKKQIQINMDEFSNSQFLTLREKDLLNKYFNE